MMSLIPLDEIAAEVTVPIHSTLLKVDRQLISRAPSAVATGAVLLVEFLEPRKKKPLPRNLWVNSAAGVITASFSVQQRLAWHSTNHGTFTPRRWQSSMVAS
jgi:hypothetical protein